MANEKVEVLEKSISWIPYKNDMPDPPIYKWV